MLPVFNRIYNILIKPVLANKPLLIDKKDFLSYMFSVDTRIISRYIAMKSFTMPGLYMVHGMHAQQGTGPKFRNIKKGVHLWVRVDDHNPEEVQIEHDGNVFKLTRDEWNATRPDLKLGKNQQEI